MSDRDYFRQQALELLSHRQISKDAIAAAQVHALLALSADPEPALTAAGFPVQPDLPAVLHEVHAAIDPEFVQETREYLRDLTDDELRARRDWWLKQAVVAVAYLMAVAERLAAGSDD